MPAYRTRIAGADDDREIRFENRGDDPLQGWVNRLRFWALIWSVIAVISAIASITLLLT